MIVLRRYLCWNRNKNKHISFFILYQCSVCNEAYLNASSLKAHLLHTHDVTMTVNEIAKLILKDHTEIKKVYSI